MRWIAALGVALLSCGLESGGPDAPDSAVDAPFDSPMSIDAAMDAGKDAPIDSGVDSPPQDTGVDSPPADTGSDGGCMICCITENDCPQASDVCLLNLCTPCGFPVTEGKRCKDGNTCHQASSMCK